MILEMKRALEELKKGDSQGYRRLYDAWCGCWELNSGPLEEQYTFLTA